MIDIRKKDKAAVLAALYNHSRPQGMGFLHYDPAPMSHDEARAIMAATEGRGYFDYLKGRVMKVDISGNTLNPGGYDHDLGPGAAARAVATVPDSK